MRNRYLDLLRAAAIVRVIVYHLFGWPWLSILLPAMGIMFALAGSLTAASLEKRDAGKVVFSRLRRLLPPLWLLGLIAVPAMIVVGWRAETDGEHPFSVPRLLFWLLPIGDPPGSDQMIDWWEPLWYLRAYLWFVVLSPVMYAAYRRFAWGAVAAPLLIMGFLDVTGFGLPDTADAALWDFVTFGACWIAGFAHHDGRLARLKPWLAFPLAAALGAAALYWLSGHQGEDPWDLNDVAESQALWSLAFVLVVLRWQPAMEWLARVRPLDKLVTLLNNRAVTVYLWHNIAIAAVWPALTLLALDDLEGKRGELADLAAALLLTAVAVVFFGWAEDLAARRSPRLWPTASGRPPRPGPPAEPVRVASHTNPLRADTLALDAPVAAGPGAPASPSGPVAPAGPAFPAASVPPAEPAFAAGSGSPAAPGFAEGAVFQAGPAFPDDAAAVPEPDFAGGVAFSASPAHRPVGGSDEPMSAPSGRHAAAGDADRAGRDFPIAGRPAAHHPPAGDMAGGERPSWPARPADRAWPQENADRFRGRRAADQPPPPWQ